MSGQTTFPSPLEGEGRGGGWPLARRRATISSWSRRVQDNSAALPPTRKFGCGRAYESANLGVSASAASSRSDLTLSTSFAPMPDSSSKSMVDSTRIENAKTRCVHAGLKNEAIESFAFGTTTSWETRMALYTPSWKRLALNPPPCPPPQGGRKSTVMRLHGDA